MASSCDLDIVIVSYHCRELMRQCLTSIREHAPRCAGTRVFVIDNASRDGTAEMVKREFPEVIFDACESNLGFARATNRGIRLGNAPYVLVLNPDTVVTTGALDLLVDVMAQHRKVGMCGCTLVRLDGTLDHAAKRAFPTPRSAIGHFTGLARYLTASSSWAQYRAPDVVEGPVDAINGACMLIRRVALEEVGLFDEGYWMYMEDLDLCYRFAQAGWAVWYEPSGTIIHVKAGTSGPLRGLRLNYAFHYGMFRFYRKHYAAGTHMSINLLVYGGIATKFGISTIRLSVLRLLRLNRAQLLRLQQPHP